MTVRQQVTYYLSRISFVTVHLVFVYWLNFVLDDPFKVGVFNTLDSITRSSSCTTWDQSAFLSNLSWFLFAWWLPHSLLARKRVKQFLGLWQSDLDRPLFAIIAPFGWLATLLTWTPIDTCALPLQISTDFFSVHRLVLHASVFAAASVLLLGLFYLLPNHVFGTDRHTWTNGKQPQTKHDIIWTFPYGVVRHPAAAAFLWFYWGFIPTFSVNHVVLASLWTVFIVVGTLVFEEGGLRGQDEFGVKYNDYAKRVNAFIPSFWSFKALFGAHKRS